MPARFRILTVIAMACATVLLCMRAYWINNEIHEVEVHGGGTNYYMDRWLVGPNRVTFHIPGARHTLKDSDSFVLKKSFAVFRNLHTIDFMGTNIGDDFIRNVAKKGLAKKINISDTKCTEQSIRILAETQSCEVVRVHSLDISRDVRVLANRMDVEIVDLEDWIKGTSDNISHPAPTYSK